MDLEQALQKISELEGKLKPFEGIDPAQFKQQSQTLTEQLQAAQNQLSQYKATSEQTISDLRSQLTNRDLQSEFTKAFGTNKGLPEYQDVLQSAILPQLEMKDGKPIAKDGRDLSAVLTEAKTKYPAMFAPDQNPGGSGAEGSNAPTQQPGTATYTPKNNVISGLDPAEVISGKVRIQ